MRVFLDTNVLVSAFATRGLCADLVRVVLTEHELLTAQAVLSELRDVLTRKLGLPKERVKDVLAFLAESRITPEPVSLPPLDLSEDDARILAAALGVHADVLVTGDTDLLRLAGQVPDIEIVSPRGFWDRITQREGR